MKKIIFSALILIIITFSPAFAQPENKSSDSSVEGLCFGIKGSLALPGFFWLEDLSWNSVTLTAIHGGAWLFGEIPLTEYISIQAEAGFSGKGSYLSAEDGKMLWLFHYLEFPLWLKYYSVRQEDMNFYAGAGGYFSLFLGGYYNFEVPGSEWNGSGALSTGQEDIVTEIRSYDFGMLFYFGYEANNFFYEFRFPVGLYPVIEFTPSDPSYGGFRKAINSGFNLCLGYKF